ncbi:hypothetical protein DV737_g2908, partial [Chaetothyriales sp. CBS 132003]
MPSLFHRRTRSASAQRPQMPASSSAHVAAVQAFQASHAASAINAPRGRGRGRGRGGLERTDSAGSMCERTFRRSPSPGHPAAAAAADTQPAPPVPKLPAQLPAVAQRRAASLDMPAGRLASPPMTAPQANAQTTAAALVVANQQRLAATTTQRPESGNWSINFSRPLSPLSPPQPSLASAVPRSRVLAAAISPAEAEQVTASVNSASQQPVKRKKKTVAPQLVQGSHLATGHMAAKPAQSAASDTPLPSPVASLASQSTVSTADSDSDSTPEKGRRQLRASGTLAKQPSVVREDWEGEQKHEHEHEMADVRQKEAQGLRAAAEPLNAVQSRKSLTAANVSRKLGEPTSPILLSQAAQVIPQSQAAQPIPQSQAAADSRKIGQTPAPSRTKPLAASNAQVARLPSASPTRAAHFSDRLASDMAAGQKHEPLPRSVSPAKSALKHPPSSPKHHPSPPSAAGAGSRVRGSSVTPSDASDSNLSADGQLRRKKSVRVSFGPSVDAIGVAAGPVDLDPWPVRGPRYAEQHAVTAIYGSGGKAGRPAAMPSSQEQQTDDDHIEPRPQLPSFGSVRSKAWRADSPDAVDTPRTSHLLQPPTAASASASTSLSEPSSSPGSQASVESASSDHAIGALFAQDAHAKGRQAGLAERTTPAQPAQPAQVGSVEAADNVSATKTDTSADGRTEAATEPKPKPPAVPALAVQPPTPGSDSHNPADQWALDVPGGFPVSADDLARTPVATAGSAAGSTATASSVSGPPAQAALTLNTVSTLATVAGATAADESSSDHDNDSIYSDAEEDLPDRDGDGFASIDAVVESPIVASALTHLPSPPASPLADRPRSARITVWDAAQQRWNGIAQQSRQAQGAESSRPAEPSRPAQAATLQPAAFFRQSMRAPAGPGPNEPPAFRQSMRAQAASARDPSFRQSLRLAPAASAAEPTTARPKSMFEAPSTPPSQQRAALQKRRIPSAALSRPPTTTPAARLSYDSDSESSFKKSRRTTATSGGRGTYTMRRSMRAGPSDVPAHSDGRGVARSLSPPRRRPFSPRSEPKAFRSTMRVSTDPPLQPGRSSSLFSASRKAVSPASSQAVPVAAARPSRILDDSDDEDLPRRKNSDDEPKQKAVHTTAAAALSPQMSSQPATKKKGLLSLFRNKKKADDDQAQANGAELSTLGFSSAAERDAVVAQTMARLEAAKLANGQQQQRTTTARAPASRLAPVPEQESGPPAPVHGRLQRRVSSPPVQDSWPLPPNQDALAGRLHRPSTSDGLLSAKAALLPPGTLDQVPSSETLPAVVGRGGKKKAFPLLRKAFGLKD